MMPGENSTPHAAGGELLGLHISQDPGTPPKKRRLEAQARCKQHTRRIRGEPEKVRAAPPLRRLRGGPSSER